MFRELEPVALRAPLPTVGLPDRALGTIVHVYSKRDYEVEFVTASGKTAALVTLSTSKLRKVTDQDLLCVSRAQPTFYARRTNRGVTRSGAVRERRRPK